MPEKFLKCGSAKVNFSAFLTEKSVPKFTQTRKSKVAASNCGEFQICQQ
jgi:hypothetical protein